VPITFGLGIARIFAELVGAIDAVEGRGEVQRHRHIHLAQLEDDRVGIGRLDRFDVLMLALREDTTRAPG
jgi:hypothetical protein